MKLGVVYKKSELELTLEKGTEEEKLDASLNPRIIESHNIQKTSIYTALEQLDKAGLSYDIMAREDFKGNGYDAYAVLGGDGTVLDVSQYVTDTPMITIQIDPKYSVGHYCQGHAKDIIQLVERNNIRQIPRIEAFVNEQSHGLVLNEVYFSHIDQADLAKYHIDADGYKEKHKKSSGVLVGTGGGSTGWIKNEGGIVTSMFDTRIQVLERASFCPTNIFAEEEVKITNLTRQAELRVDGKFRKVMLNKYDEIIFRPGTPLRVYT